MDHTEITDQVTHDVVFDDYGLRVSRYGDEVTVAVPGSSQVFELNSFNRRDLHGQHRSGDYDFRYWLNEEDGRWHMIHTFPASSEDGSDAYKTLHLEVGEDGNICRHALTDKLEKPGRFSKVAFSIPAFFGAVALVCWAVVIAL